MRRPTHDMTKSYKGYIYHVLSYCTTTNLREALKEWGKHQYGAKSVLLARAFLAVQSRMNDKNESFISIIKQSPLADRFKVYEKEHPEITSWPSPPSTEELQYCIKKAIEDSRVCSLRARHKKQMKQAEQITNNHEHDDIHHLNHHEMNGGADNHNLHHNGQDSDGADSSMHKSSRRNDDDDDEDSSHSREDNVLTPRNDSLHVDDYLNDRNLSPNGRPESSEEELDPELRLDSDPEHEPDQDHQSMGLHHHPGQTQQDQQLHHAPHQLAHSERLNEQRMSLRQLNGQPHDDHLDIDNELEHLREGPTGLIVGSTEREKEKDQPTPSPPAPKAKSKTKPKQFRRRPGRPPLNPLLQRERERERERELQQQQQRETSGMSESRSKQRAPSEPGTSMYDTPAVGENGRRRKRGRRPRVSLPPPAPIEKLPRGRPPNPDKLINGAMNRNVPETKQRGRKRKREDFIQTSDACTNEDGVNSGDDRLAEDRMRAMKRAIDVSEALAEQEKKPSRNEKLINLIRLHADLVMKRYEELVDKN